MKIVNVANDVSTAVVNVNASDTNETSTKMMTARMNMLLENRECSKPLSMGRNLPQILCATESDVESVSRNLLMLLVRFRYILLMTFRCNETYDFGKASLFLMVHAKKGYVLLESIASCILLGYELFGLPR